MIVDRSAFIDLYKHHHNQWLQFAHISLINNANKSTVIVLIFQNLKPEIFTAPLGYTPLNIHEIWLRLLLGEHLLYIRAKMTSFVNSLD